MHLEWTLSHSSLVGVLYCHRLTSASVFCLDCVYLQIYTHKNKTQKMFKSTVEYYKRKCNPLSTQTPISGRLAQNARKRTMDMDMDMDRSWSAEPEAIRAMPLAEEGGHQMEGRWMGCGSVSESAHLHKEVARATARGAAGGRRQRGSQRCGCCSHAEGRRRRRWTQWWAAARSARRGPCGASHDVGVPS